jgi:hypothetical protein
MSEVNSFGMTVDDYKKILKESVANVIFSKADGSERKMRCSLRAEDLPPVESSKIEGSSKKPSTTVVSVWDLDNQGWRSFRIDSVKDFSTEY